MVKRSRGRVFESRPCRDHSDLKHATIILDRNGVLYCCNPANGRLDIEDLLAYNIQLHGGNLLIETLSAKWDKWPTTKNDFAVCLCSGGRSSGQPSLSVRLLFPHQRTQEPSRQRRQLPLSVSGKKTKQKHFPINVILLYVWKLSRYENNCQFVLNSNSRMLKASISEMGID